MDKQTDQHEIWMEFLGDIDGGIVMDRQTGIQMDGELGGRFIELRTTNKTAL